VFPFILFLYFVVLISSVYFILLDELIIGIAQRRIGPFNVGRYGIPPSIINGLNPIITQLIIPKFLLDNIMALTYSLILVFSIYPIPLVVLLYFVCLIRPTMNRSKFDELMTCARLVILPIIFSFPILVIILYY